MKALAELALFLQLDKLFATTKNGSLSDEITGRNWAWFPSLCMAAEVTNALFKRQPFPDSFAEAVGTKDVIGLVSLSLYLTLISILSFNSVVVCFI